MNYGLHHHSKQRHREHTQRDTSRRFKFIFDRLAYAAGVMIALMTAPQIWQIYSTQDATGVSFATWLLYGLGSAFWITYGLVHNEKPIVFTNVVAATLQLTVAVGAFLYS